MRSYKNEAEQVSNLAKRAVELAIEEGEDVASGLVAEFRIVKKTINVTQS